MSVGLVMILLAVVLPAAFGPANGQAASTAAEAGPRRGAIITINAHRRGPQASPMVLGSNHRFPFRGYGMWNTDRNAPEPRVVSGTRMAGISMLRYPGGSRANFFDWREAIGPREKRGCQVYGKLGAGRGVRATYGIREHMRFARRVGARTLITMPFLNETPRDAAAWVEFMNDPVGGRNPNGGRAWAGVRKQHGHPAPYNVRTWTIGNEPYLHNQRFWLGNDDGTAMRRYVNGARIRFTGQEVGKRCAFKAGEARLNQQQREIKYPPVAPGSETIMVRGKKWQRVKSVEAQGPNARVYEIDNSSGKLTFGDGEHGLSLPRKPNLRASYTSVHAGFAAMRRAMKNVDRSINVCSEWSRPAFVRFMGQRRYDCVAAHPYRIFSKTFANPLDAHDSQMDAERKVSRLLPRLRRTLKREHRSDVSVLVTEYGAISIPTQNHAPHWDLGMSDALFMASQVVGFVRRGVPVATGGALTSFQLRSTLGHAPSWTRSAWAVTSGQLSRVIRKNSTVLASKVSRGRWRSTRDERYPALITLAVRKGHRAYLVVVNRHPTKAATAQLRVRRGTIAGKRIRISTVVSRRPWTFNSPQHPRAVRVVSHGKRVGKGSPVLRYRPHSVTVLRFRIR